MDVEFKPLILPGEDIFIVEDIIDKKVHGKGTKYLVKWLGLPIEESTWEPKSHLISVKNKIIEFENRININNSKIEKPIEEDKKPDMEENLICGNIDKGDTPKRIKSAKYVSPGNILCLVEWNERINGIQPSDTYVSNKVLRNEYYNLLLDFYESKIKFNSS
jgi:hypothetical protein